MKKLFALLPLVALLTVGCGVTTTGGHHVGYVTAVEQNGLVWKTGAVYLKTNVTASQEDKYCVTDPAVMSELSAFNDSQARVRLTYHSEIMTAPWRCDSEDAIIDAVEADTSTAAN